MRRLTLAILGAAALAAAASRPASADWLVTREGARIETRGTWQVKGRLVVFTRADGALASLRLGEVDLDASRRATAEAAAAPAPPAAAASRRAVRAITDKDVRHLGPATAASGEDAGAPAAAGQKPAGEPTGKGLAVASWEQLKEATSGSIVLEGRLRNTTGATALRVSLTVRLYDETGTLVGETLASLATSALSEGQETTFRAAFPSVFAFSDVQFEARSVNVASAPEPRTGEAG